MLGELGRRSRDMRKADRVGVFVILGSGGGIVTFKIVNHQSGFRDRNLYSTLDLEELRGG